MEDILTKTNPHAIMVPLYYQGHITPSINLALTLASRGFTITFVNTQIAHHQMAKPHADIFARARSSGLDVRYKMVSDGFPLSFDRVINHQQFAEGSLFVFQAHVDELVGNLVRNDGSISSLICDTFYTWTSTIANKYKLVNISFWTQPALVFTLNYHLELLVKNGHFASKDNREDFIDYIPGVKSINPKDLTSFLQSTETTTIAHRITYKAFEDVKNADFILCNSVQELESDTICSLQHKQPFYVIGPIIPSELTKSIVPTSLRTELDCTQWLDTKPNGSVLYISFGSFIPSRRSNIEEIAHGLVLSKVNFLWVLRPGTVSYEESYILPKGFDNEVKDKGLVVTWTDQTKVLSHPAIGGFLTHCGWNSVLESVCCNAVPLLCFPLIGDQLTNRKLVVDDWGIGINICDRKPLTRTEVAEKIKHLMDGKSAEILWERAMKVRETFDNAMAMDGSSEKNLCQFISDVKDKIRRNKESV